MQFLLAPENSPYVIALVLMCGIATLELVASLFGAGFSGALEAAMPELDTDVSIDGHEHSSNMLSKFLGWLHVGKVPVLIVLITALTVFGLIGLILQWFILKLLGTLLAAIWLVVPVALLSLPLVRATTLTLHRLMPSDETEAVSEKTFIGRVATITLGHASKDNPAEARLVDEHGQSHYVLLEPSDASDVFKTGERVLAVDKRGTIFVGIRHKSSALA